jgi:hypothetical protein
MGHVAHVGETTWRTSIDGRIILEWILEKLGGKFWTGFI